MSSVPQLLRLDPTLGLYVQNRGQVDIINDSVLYVRPEGDGQFRFSMEKNKFGAKKGEEPDGVLVVKFHAFTGLSYKTAMAVKRSWKSLDVLTLRQLILFIDYIWCCRVW